MKSTSKKITTKKSITKPTLPVDIDDAEDEIVPTISYDISTYGSDPDVETLVKRLKTGQLSIPSFQREYVWKISEASRLIESLLLGLPIPSIFLAKEKESNKFLVLDGQQRLRTMQYYIEGIFIPLKKPFALTGVQKRYEGKTFNELSSDDQDRINQSVIHCTNIKQNTPDDDDTSIYHIFKRLNSEGRKLSEQEIRSAVYHGTLLDIIHEINDNSNWRAIFGAKNARKKDEELILRFFAFKNSRSKYERPLSEFLNKFCGKYRNRDAREIDILKSEFENCIGIVYDRVGTKAFRPVSSFNAAAFESIMIGISENYKKISKSTKTQFMSAYNALITNADYLASVTKSTSDEGSVSNRFELAIKAFKI